MNAVRRKLNSSSGASILMALLLLLVAVMVSAVILAAAVSAAKTIRTDREQQQTYLTVSSAAALVRDSILNGSGNYTTINTEIYAYSDHTGLLDSTSSESLATGNFSSIMNKGIKTLKAQPLFPYSYTCTIQDENKQYEPVTAVFSLTAQNSEADGQISYLLTVTFTAGSGDHLCKMALKMDGKTKATPREYTRSYNKNGWSYNPAYCIETTTTIDWTQIPPVISRERVTSN